MHSIQACGSDVERADVHVIDQDVSADGWSVYVLRRQSADVKGLDRSQAPWWAHLERKEQIAQALEENPRSSRRLAASTRSRRSIRTLGLV